MSGIHDDTVAQHNESAPDWLAARRQKGLEAWANAAMPTSKDEDWRYVDLDFTLDEYRPVQAAGSPLADNAFLQSIGSNSGSLTMIDGYLVDSAADPAVVGSAASVDAPIVSERYGTAVGPHVDVFAAAHHALSPSGAVVFVPRNTVCESPIVVDVQAVTDGAVSFPHLTIVGEANSEATVVVVYRSGIDTNALCVPVIEAFADDGARLSISVVQQHGRDMRMVGHHQYVLGRDATIKIDEIGLGSSYARQRLGIDLEGSGSSVEVGGIYFGDGDQVLDYRVFVTHRGPRTTSNIFLKGAVADQARAVWTGLMRIEHGADGTSAFETNRNLVLSDGAKVNSVPNLEILTDDLQCGHGSSSGPLDEGHLYYLMSRGLPQDRAERLLVRAFFDEILSKLVTPALAGPARDQVAAKFAEAQDRLLR